MSYAIIGSGAIGGALAKQFARNKIKTVITNRRGPASLEDALQAFAPAVSAAKTTDALDADVIILAVPFGAVGEVAKLRGDWSGKIVVDATNAIEFPAFTPLDLGGRPSSQVVAAQFKGAKVVKAFNTLPAAVLGDEPRRSEGQRTIFVSGDHAEANEQVASLATSLGFSPITLGRLEEGGLLQQFGGPLMVHSLIKQR
ncbi:NADPH-dependent F420 reductase [Dyella tabacisoli]|uniref:NADP oxidoreductase n=1 Tax=Dyella tabacisoli TaxID=2282381 RepID=A0A369UMP3_9GAMM|nr:NADPH-dependent F420 reductase [Dyella tabacisoli]RDD80988.1 NADP oxidoreductase [Dyella tabacisoli]